jgi:hypothetical protein
MLDASSPVERHFIEAVREVKELEKGKPASAKKKRKISGGRKSRAAKESRINLDGKDL